MNAMGFSKIIMREGSRYKVDINIEKINETIEYSNFIPVKLNNKIISVPIYNNSNLSDDKAKSIVSKFAPDVIEKIKEFIKKEWIYWVGDNVNLAYSDELVNEMIVELFNLVTITPLRNRVYSISYYLNNIFVPCNSKKFSNIQNRVMLIALGHYKNGIFDFKYCSIENLEET